ncbi:thioesterase II family protein [Actinophytocola gossypii]|uniref:Thioesterase n=1 Tax=Actinophytocola gossypii TaxID=2812003 RepID=A0ABT2J2N8_9PSEU|nr:alpha/beta fold hydrolase [Actinophytocola gossypii]MCT2581936.1 thioesterase [Actinophytocola gossypii]
MTATTKDAAERWLSRAVPRPDAEVELFCLPYAGAGASAYREWPAAFGPEIEVTALRLPGRENRIRERPEVDPVAVASVIASVVGAGRPYALFGHSMGGRLGFEVIRELRRAGRPLPVRLYPSGIIPPDQRSRSVLDGVSRVPDDELVERLTAGGGMPEVLLAEPDLLDLFLPVLRADLTWLDDYEYVPGDPIPVPVVAFAGESDPVAPLSKMDGWTAHTSAGFTLHTLPGGHFFLHEQVDRIAGVIMADLLGTRTP